METGCCNIVWTMLRHFLFFIFYEKIEVEREDSDTIKDFREREEL